MHHPEIGTPPISNTGSSSSSPEKSSIDVLKEVLQRCRRNSLSGKSVCITGNQVLEEMKAMETEKIISYRTKSDNE